MAAGGRRRRQGGKEKEEEEEEGRSLGRREVWIMPGSAADALRREDERRGGESGEAGEAGDDDGDVATSEVRTYMHAHVHACI